MNILWIICLILAVAFIGLEIKNLLSTNEKALVRIAKMVLCLAAASFVLYLPIFFLQNNFFTALAADLINIMRIVTMDAGYLDSKEFIISSIGNDMFYRLYMAAMGLMHFLMPLLSIMAIYSIFFMCVAHLRVFVINIQIYRPVFIFNTTDNRAVQMALDIQKRISKGAFIFTDVRDKSQSGDVDILKSTVVHPDSIENIRIRRTRSRDVYYFLLSDDENTNIRQALDQISLLSGQEKEIQKHTHLLVAVRSDEAEIMIDSSTKGEVEVNIIREEELSVYKLLDEHPLYCSTGNGIISVLVLGFDAIGENFVRAASWCGQIQGYKLRINVVGIDIADEISDFRFRYPGYEGCPYLELNFFDCAGNKEVLDTIINNCKDTTYAVITQGTDMENTETAIRLRREFLKQDDSFNRIPEIYAYVRNKEQADVLNDLKTSEADPDKRVSYRLVSFGSEEDVFTYENIIDSDRERLAVNVHLVYESIVNGGEINISQELEDYNRFEVYKRSNVANAMHIRYKLSQLGLDYTRDTDAEEVDFGLFLTEDKLDELVRAEHQRWQMFMISDGWSSADMDDVAAFRDSGLSMAQFFCPLLELHPYICAFDELEERAQYLGSTNEAEYYRELIRRIPEILHDRWNVAGVSYKIVKKKFK